MYQNADAYWGTIGEMVTPQWYAARAAVLGVAVPTVVVTRVGLVINGAVVALRVE